MTRLGNHRSGQPQCLHLWKKWLVQKIYLRGGVFKMHVLYFEEWRDGSLHDGMINFKKTSKSIYKCKINFLGSTQIT